MRISGLLALCLLLTFTAADGMTSGELLIVCLMALLVISPGSVPK